MPFVAIDHTIAFAIDAPIKASHIQQLDQNIDNHETRITNGEAGGFPVGVAPAVGNYVAVANDDEVGVDPPGYTKCKETIWKGQAGAFRVKFSMRSPGGNLLYGRVYRNGVAVGTVRSTSSTTSVEFSEDISGWSYDDLIQVYIYRSAGGGVCYASRLRLCVAAPPVGGGLHGN